MNEGCILFSAFSSSLELPVRSSRVRPTARHVSRSFSRVSSPAALAISLRGVLCLFVEEAGRLAVVPPSSPRGDPPGALTGPARWHGARSNQDGVFG